MRVFKFGGASIATPGRMVDLLPIIKSEQEPLVIVVSAYGKTTNALERILTMACSGQMNEALQLLEQLKSEHLQYAQALLDSNGFKHLAVALEPHFEAITRHVQEAQQSRFNFCYDQVVGMGEIFSTLLFSFYLRQAGIKNEWVDARRIICTDDTWRDANVDWATTQHQAQTIIAPQLAAGHSVVTQGFIGATTNGHAVTLGREGSDYTAAMLAAMLLLHSLTIWKDVPGLLNADPKQFPGTVRIEAITYNEVIEMAFYGAQIIHPKTIKPLQNHNIPLYVKCFLDPSLPGTVVQNEVTDANYPPLIVLKKNQVLLQVTTRDFSFITESNLSNLYAIFRDLHIHVNLIQNAAISFVACLDNQPEKIRELTEALAKYYKVLQNDNVSLLTIRHYNAEIVANLTHGRQILLKQETRKTLQVILT